MTAVISTLSNAPAESVLVGTAMLWPASFDDANVAPVDFENPMAKAAWQAIGTLRAAGAGVSPLTVVDAFRDTVASRSAAIGTLSEWSQLAVNSTMAKDLAGIVRRAALGRRLKAVCGETLARLNGLDSDVEATLADHRAACAMLESGIDDEPRCVPDSLHEVLDGISLRCSSPVESAVRTGIGAFDRATGGLRPGRQIVVAARPGGGKSAWGIQVCASAGLTSRTPSLVFSLEMSLQEQVERMLAGASGINVAKIGKGNLGFGEFVKLQSGASKFSALPMWIHDKPVKLDKLQAIARRWHARNVATGQMSVIMIDYIGLVQSTSSRRSREQEVAEISRTGKALAMQLGAVVIMVSQLNRDAEKENRDPRLSDLRESGAIEQDADMVIFPVRDKDGEDARGDGPARLLVAKNRTGATGEIEVQWEGRFTRFVDAPTYLPPPPFNEPLGDR